MCKSSETISENGIQSSISGSWCESCKKKKQSNVTSYTVVMDSTSLKQDLKERFTPKSKMHIYLTILIVLEIALDEGKNGGNLR